MADGRRTSAHAALLLALVVASCAAPPRLQRSHGGQVYAGRVIPARAYAAYARGLRAESEGRHAEAEAAYAEVTRWDPASGSAWAARGRLACRRSSARAEELFARGLESAEEPAPLYVARSDCRLEQGRAEDAARDAERALASAPLEPDASRALERALSSLGQFERARAVQLAARQLTHAHEGRAPLLVSRERSWPALDAALARGDLRGARRAAPEDCSAGLLSLRALALGHPELARAQALWVLRADPSQIDARLTVWLLAASATAEREGEGEPPLARSPFDPSSPDVSSLAPPPPLPAQPSTLGVLLFARHLLRTADRSACAAFLEAAGALEPRDALERELARDLPLRRGAEPGPLTL